MGKSFSYAQYGNSIVAILAGQIANRAANFSEFKPISEDSGMYAGGCLGPFDVSLLALIAVGFFASNLWEENYGGTKKGGDTNNNKNNSKNNSDYDDPAGAAEEDDDSKGDKSTAASALRGAFDTTIRSSDILSCGIISSLFEGSMYIFVFFWSPAMIKLSKADLADGEEFEGLPFGIIFSTFMVCCMVGSSIFSIAMETMKPEQLAVIAFSMASFAFLIMSSSNSTTSTFLSMNVFEVCVGMYFPSMGTMKGMIVPEDKRAAIYTLFRIPLNFIVLFSLLTDLTPHVSFVLCGLMMVVATMVQWRLKSRRIEA